MLHSAITESIRMNSHRELYCTNAISLQVINTIYPTFKCALSWDIENSDPISSSSHVLFCLLYKHHRHLQTNWKATLLRNENLPFIHQPSKVARKAGDVQQLIGDINQRILYDKHLFLVIFPLALQFSQIIIFHFLCDNVSKNNNGELFFYCKQLLPLH